MSDFGQPPGWAPPPGSQPGGFQQQPGGFQQQPGAPYGAPGGFGPPPGGMGGQQGASPMAIVSLVLACLSFVACGNLFFSIPGAIIGKMEMTKIANGQSPKAGDGLAKAGFYISLANIALCVVGGCLYGLVVAFALAASAAQS